MTLEDTTGTLILDILRNYSVELLLPKDLSLIIDSEEDGSCCFTQSTKYVGKDTNSYPLITIPTTQHTFYCFFRKFDALSFCMGVVVDSQKKELEDFREFSVVIKRMYSKLIVDGRRFYRPGDNSIIMNDPIIVSIINEGGGSDV
ncbi:MAG: hypothetical protein GY861_21285 [bacterium]|nr:hypothetical protein [bacterium]